MKAQLLVNNQWMETEAPRHVEKAFEMYKDCPIIEVVSSMRPRFESTLEELQADLNPHRPEHFFRRLAEEVWRRIPTPESTQER